MYILKPPAARFLYAPPFYTPPTPRRVFSWVGGWGCIKFGPVWIDFSLGWEELCSPCEGGKTLAQCWMEIVRLWVQRSIQHWAGVCGKLHKARLKELHRNTVHGHHARRATALHQRLSLIVSLFHIVMSTDGFQRHRNDNINKICVLEGVWGEGKFTENWSQNAVFPGKFHDNKI